MYRSNLYVLMSVLMSVSVSVLSVYVFIYVYPSVYVHAYLCIFTLSCCFWHLSFYWYESVCGQGLCVISYCILRIQR